VLFIGEAPSRQLRARIRAASQIWIMSPSPAIPIEQILPGSTLVEARFFPWVGTVERVHLD
jgi:hypothetical protein